MKRRAGFAFAVFVVCAAALMFAAACDPDGLESKTPKPMSDYLEETTDAFVSALAGSAEDGRIAVSLDGTFGEDTVYTVFFGFCFDPDDPDSSVLAFGLDDGEGGSVSVISAGSDTYADISLRDSAANGKVKYVNIGIFDWLSDGVGADERIEFSQKIARRGQFILAVAAHGIDRVQIIRTFRSAIRNQFGIRITLQFFRVFAGEFFRGSVPAVANVKPETDKQRPVRHQKYGDVDERKYAEPAFCFLIEPYHTFSVHIYPVDLIVLRFTSKPNCDNILRRRKIFISIT